jgi:hypothetical protein
MAEHEDPAPESVNEQLRIFEGLIEREKSTEGTLLWKCHNYDKIAPVTTHAELVALIDNLLNIYDRWPVPCDKYDRVRCHLRSRAGSFGGEFEGEHTWGQPLVEWRQFSDAPNLVGDAKAAVDELRMWAVKKTAAASKAGDNQQVASAAEVENMLNLVGDEVAVKILTVARRADLTVDERARAILRLDQRYEGYKSPKWADLLKVSEQAIRDAPFWKELHPKKPRKPRKPNR